MGMLLLTRSAQSAPAQLPESAPEARKPARRGRSPGARGPRGRRAVAHRGGPARRLVAPLPHAAGEWARERLAGAPRGPGGRAARPDARAVRPRRLERAGAARGAARL